MELRKVKEDGKTLMIEVAGETFTVTNALREELWEVPGVTEAAQVREHPYLSQPKVFVKTERGTPESALEKAAEKVASQAREFQAQFKKVSK